MSKQKSSHPKKKERSRSKKIRTKAAQIRNFSVKKRLATRRVQKVEAKKSHKKITGSFRLFADSASMFRQHWKIFGGILFVYLVLSVALIGVRGSGLDIDQMKEYANDSTEVGQLGANLVLLSVVAGSSTGPSTQSGAAYQSIVLLIVSLAIVWALRQIMAGKKIRIRDTFYKGTYPLVPVVLVMLVIGLQLIPISVGGFLAGVGFTGAVAISFWEQVLWSVAIFLLVLWSLHMLSASLFAFYIVTLPNMAPIKALRSARELVRFRRWTLMRKLLFLPFALFLIGIAVMLPFIWFLPAAAQWMFILLSMIGLAFVHIYLYSLYRELL